MEQLPTVTFITQSLCGSIQAIDLLITKADAEKA